MDFRYDFGEKLDLCRFKIQSVFFLKQKKNVRYLVYLSDFHLILEMHNEDVHYEMSVKIYELIRDVDDEIIVSNYIDPMRNDKLKGIGIIKRFFGEDNYIEQQSQARYVFNPEFIVTEFCQLIKVLHKWSELKAFL